MFKPFSPISPWVSGHCIACDMVFKPFSSISLWCPNLEAMAFNTCPLICSWYSCQVDPVLCDFLPPWASHFFNLMPQCQPTLKDLSHSHQFRSDFQPISSHFTRFSIQLIPLPLNHLNQFAFVSPWFLPHFPSISPWLSSPISSCLDHSQASSLSLALESF